MKHTHVVGVDPGIVHTGVVYMRFDPATKTITVGHEVIVGPDGPACRRYLETLAPLKELNTFVEGYRARSNLQHDKRMQVGVETIRSCVHGKVLDNTGVKKIVKPAVLMALGAWIFSTPTHHDDLRSAARIAVLGMMKDPDMNRLLADVIRDHLAGKPWTIRTI